MLATGEHRGSLWCFVLDDDDRHIVLPGDVNGSDDPAEGFVTGGVLDGQVALEVLLLHLGSEATATVARHLVIAPQREGDQAQYVDRPVAAEAGDAAIGETMSWALARLDQALSVDVLARRASMRPRNFTRRFKETAGTSPARWILTRRLDGARRLLEMTSWSITRIASACGFASAVTFRQNFSARFATTPTSYRHRFNSVDAPEHFPGGTSDGSTTARTIG